MCSVASWLTNVWMVAYLSLDAAWSKDGQNGGKVGLFIGNPAQAAIRACFALFHRCFSAVAVPVLSVTAFSC